MPRKDRRWTMSEPEMRSLLTTMKTMGHEALAHDLFFDCFPELGSVLQMGGMKTTSLFRMALLYFLFVLTSPIFPSSPFIPAILSPHPPIVIDGDDNFTSTNGVTGGRGGATDPYVIEGWLIDATSSNGITIRQTRAHLVIRNLTIEA